MPLAWLRALRHRLWRSPGWGVWSALVAAGYVMLMVRVVLVAGRAGVVVARLVALQAAQAFFHTPTVLGRAAGAEG